MSRFTQAGRWRELRVAIAALALFVAAAFVVSTPLPALAAPAVGTVIGNQATANYTDAGGTSRTTTSNLVQTTVTQVKSFTLTAPGAVTAAGGQTVYFAHTIANTGNGIDTYAFNAPATGGAFTHTGPGPGPVYYNDADGNGVPDNFTALATTGPVAAGGIFRFVLAGVVPGAAAGVGTMTASVSDTSGGPALTNLDSTTVANSAIFVSKGLSVTSGASPNAGPITVTLAYNNTGSAAATSLVLTDALPSGMTYVAGSGVWNGSILLTDAAAGDPAGITYEFSAGQVIATIASVPAGASGTLAFNVQIPGGRPPGFINNFATYQTTTQATTNTNTASYQVVRTAGVVANGSTTSSANGASEPVTIASATAGSTIPFTNVIWNLGNAADTFVVSLAGQGTWPSGSTFTLLQADGTTPLIANTTPSVPVYSAGCAAGFETDAANQRCGYRVVLRVQLPVGAAGGPYSVTKTATSTFDNTRTDAVIDTLTVAAASTVDLTNNAALPTTPANGQGATGTTVITTNTVTPSTAGTALTRFLLYVNNTGVITDSYNLVSSAAPAGWTVAFRDDGGLGTCATVGATITGTGIVNAGASRLVCAEVTVPITTSNQAAPGNHDFDFTATSALTATIADVKRDRVSVNAVNSVTLTPDNTQQVMPNGSFTYSHVLTNLGNVAETIGFAAGFLADTRAAQGWTSEAFVDGNANGVFEPGVDDVPANRVSTATTIPLGVNATRTIFVRVSAPAGALPADPANVTTLTARYNAGAASTAATDTTSVTGTLVLVKDHQPVSCATAAPHPAAGYSTAPILSGPSTAPGQCIAYRIRATNTTAANIGLVVVNDNIPAGTTHRRSCGTGAPGAATDVGTITSPADGATGTVSANVGTLAPGQTATVTFCARIDPAPGAPPAGSVISNQASATAVIGVTPVPASSNVVQFTTSGSSAGPTATLVASATRLVAPGSTVYFPHLLTNGTVAADTFALSVTSLPGGFDLTSIAILPDANGDGIPDSAVPVPATVALGPGGAFRFVVRVVAPIGAPQFTHDRVQVNAQSTTPGGTVLNNIDRVDIRISEGPAPDVVTARKVFSVVEGPSPYESILVSIRYGNTETARSDFRILDTIPPGFQYVPGSARWSGAGTTALTDAAGGDPAGISYDFGATQQGAVFANIPLLAPMEEGTLTFRLSVAPGRPIGEILTNVAQARWTDPSGDDSWWHNTNPAKYRVTGEIDLTLTGDRIPLAQPATTVTFSNVLTNRGTLAETFNILLGTSTFPAGTPMRLFGPDGTTPLADTNGDGLPDVGVLAAGASVRIVLKADLPATLVPGEYSVQKVAQSARSPSRRVSASDVVAAVGRRCSIDLTPDNQAQSGYGRHVTYAHYLENRGNCEEPVRVAVGFITDSLPGWVSAAYIDNPAAGGASIPGVVDRTDTPVVEGWTALIAPGKGLRILVDVLARPDPAAERQAAKALVETNITTLIIDSTTGGSLKVTDRTTIDDKDSSIQPQDVLRNFTDSSYQVPTAWAVLGGTAWLRADAGSCNAVADVAESRTLVVTGPNGEREEVLATETGPNTGIFVAPAMAVRAPPVVAGDGILQGRAFDVFDAEILGCGRRIATAITLTEPVGIVFDSAGNEPVAGAVVTLVSASGGRCSATPVSIAGNPATTGSDGRYAFTTAPAGEYCLAVATPNGYAAPSKVPYGQLAPGRNLVVTGPTSGGSYGQPFRSNGNGIVVDVPVDPIAQSGLFVQKAASRAIVDLGGFVDYVVQVRNNTGGALDRAGVLLVDDLPAGFAYIPGSGRNLAGEAREPATRGPRLVFDLGHLESGGQVALTYRVRVGPGALQGDGVNRVQATYTIGGATTVSNVAAAKVQVIGGVFSNRAYILGKVFLDCNANGMQDRGEIGMPGVRLFIEDGTFVVTDGEGRYSFYGLPDRTHVLKVDPSTLPGGARLAITGSRNLGDPASRIVDLKSGELHRGDFAIAGCGEPLLEEARARARALDAGVDALAALSGSQLATQAPVIPDVKALPASGVISNAGQPGGVAAPAPNAPVGSTSNAPLVSVLDVPFASRPAPAPRLAPQEGSAPAPAAALPPLEDLVAQSDNTLAFVGIKDGDALAFAQATIRVKGAAGATFRLSVNGTEVPEARVGKRSTLAEKQVQAWEYVGVELRAGANELQLEQFDSFGIPRGAEKIRVVAPGRLARIVIELPQAGGVADGKSPVSVVVRLFDADGVPVTTRTPVTLEASRGAWQVADPDPAQPGVQAFIEGGRGEFSIAPPLEAGSSRIVASSGNLRAEARLDFLAELRSLIAAGVIEGVVNMRSINTRALVPSREADGFEQELRHISKEWDDGKGQAGARAAFYLRGKIKGEYLLTAAYDSEKDTRERLFRDIQPDEFYPVYGDSGVRGYDAQSTSRLYVRVDKGRSYLLWGDFTTQAFPELRKLATYNRSLTGAQLHHETERVSANVFASKDSTRQAIEEIRANGTSGPFQLGSAGILVNSEKIDLVTRDRNQPALILATVPQARFVDYEIEALTGRLLFKAPVASVDRDLNPVFIRATYEVDQGGEEFWVAGVDAQVRVTDRIEVGGVYVKDKNPQQPFELAGANAVVKLGEGTYVIGEVARTTRGVDDKQGDAARLELKHESRDLKAQVFAAKSDRTFDNPGAWITNGRSESGGRVEYGVAEGTTARAEALRTEDTTTGSVRDGVLAAVTHQLTKDLSLEVGMRHARETGTTSPVPPVEGLPPPQPLPDEVTTVRTRITGTVPGVAGARVYGEAEVDVKDSDRRILAAGAEYLLPNRGRLYARHEFVSSITGPYGLNATERQNTTAVGVDVDYMSDGRLFSEYRIRDAMSGGDTEAAIGLRNLWTLAPGLRLGTSIERVHALAGTGQNENTALALGLEYTANPLWKGTTRLELRDATTAESLLFTVGLAAKLNRDWTALFRNAYSLQRNKPTEAAPAADKVIERLQAGLAWRDSETNQWNVLGRVEHRAEEDETLKGIALKSSTQIVSLHADWQPRRPFLVTGRYAAKWTTERSAALTSKYRAQLLGGRVTWEFAPRWDFGLAASALIGDSSASRHYGVGVELGYLVVTNLWVSAGYNFFGYRDADLQGADYTAKGPYVRLRYKFDEGLFGESLSGPPKAASGLAKPAKAETTAAPSPGAPVPAANGGFAPLAPSPSGPAPGAGEAVPL